MNRNKTYHSYEVGQIVYMYQARGSIVQTGSRKIACYFVGPLIIYKAIGPNQFLLMSLTGQIYPPTNRRHQIETWLNLDK